MNTVKIFIFNRILILLTICVIIMFYQYKIKYIKLQTFLIIPITLFIYYFFKLLKDGNNFSFFSADRAIFWNLSVAQK